MSKICRRPRKKTQKNIDRSAQKVVSQPSRIPRTPFCGFLQGNSKRFLLHLGAPQNRAPLAINEYINHRTTKAFAFDRKKTYTATGDIEMFVSEKVVVVAPACNAFSWSSVPGLL